MYTILLLIFYSTVSLHDYHVAKTEISFDNDSQRFEITQFLFLDDLELALETAGYQDQHLYSDKEVNSADSIIMQYIDEHIDLKDHQGEELTLKLLGRELSDDLSGVYLYLYTDEVRRAKKKFTLDNTCLTEIYDDQSNMVYWKSGKGNKSYHVLNLRETTVTLDNT